MKIRKIQPKNNKYYIRKATGGLNGAVAGKPTIPGANVLCNCVGYANGRFNESINDPNLKGVCLPFRYQLVCNAENFIESAKKQGLNISKEPVIGGIMVWQKGATLGGGDGAGHVAFVEAIYEDGSILTSESGYDAWAFKTIRRYNDKGRWGQSSAYKFRGCVINPIVKDTKKTPTPKLKVDGVGGKATVRAMQRFFGTPQDGVIGGQTKALSRYYPSLTSVEYGKGGSPCIKKLQRWVNITQDGILGIRTVKAWQKKIGVKPDGIFGTESMKVWQQYLNEHDKAVYPKKPKKSRYYSKNVLIGEACCNEYGTLSGGKPGDQTGKEVRVGNWYNGGWIYVFRAKDKAVRLKLAQAMMDTCANQNIGYNIDKPNRYAAWDHAEKNGHDIKGISKKGDTTCSQAVSMCMRACGFSKTYAPRHCDITTLTRVMLKDDAFYKYTGKDYTASSVKLQPGDILLSSHHTAIVVKSPNVPSVEK